MGKWIAGTVLALVGGFLGAWLFAASGMGNGHVHAYLLSHPQLLEEMAEALRRRDQAARLAPIEEAVKTPFPGAVIGNPGGSRVLVKFTDYACSYCRVSALEIEKLVAADKELKVVIREWPIFEGSERAARIGLAAAKQGRYPAYYKAMFEQGPPSETTIARAAAIAGLDMAEAERFAASPEASAEIAETMEFARQLGFDGTPSWIAGERILEGYFAAGKLADAVAGRN